METPRPESRALGWGANRWTSKLSCYQRGRDYRLDLRAASPTGRSHPRYHIPNNAVNWITQKNFGFSDAADLFVFISGYSRILSSMRAMMLERGTVIGATRLIKRAWQIYVAHVLLFAIYIAEIGYLAQRYHDPNLQNEFNVAGFMQNPAETLYQGLILAFKPVNMDVLPLYIALMLVLSAGAVGDVAEAQSDAAGLVPALSRGTAFRLNLPAYPSGTWYFNPFCWQFLFVFGGWFALGGASESIPFIRSRAFLWLGGAYLLFALVMTLAGRFPELGQAMPAWLYDAFNPNDKTNLALYRVLHFVVLAFFVTALPAARMAGLLNGRSSSRSSNPASSRSKCSARASSSRWSHMSCWSRSPRASGCRSWSAWSASC